MINTNPNTKNTPIRNNRGYIIVNLLGKDLHLISEGLDKPLVIQFNKDKNQKIEINETERRIYMRNTTIFLKEKAYRLNYIPRRSRGVLYIVPKEVADLFPLREDFLYPIGIKEETKDKIVAEGLSRHTSIGNSRSFFRTVGNRLGLGRFARGFRNSFRRYAGGARLRDGSGRRFNNVPREDIDAPIKDVEIPQDPTVELEQLAQSLQEDMPVEPNDNDKNQK